MQARIIGVREISPRDELAWRQLAERAIEPNPYFEPDVLTLCTKHFADFRDARLIVAEDSGRFLALLPIIKSQESRLPPRTLATTLGSRLRSLGTPLVDPSQTDEAIRTMLHGLHEQAKTGAVPGVLLLEFLHAGGPVADAIRRACVELHLPTYTKSTWERGFVTRGGRWENPFSKERKRQLDRKRRALAREAGAEPTMIDQTLDSSAADEFLRMEAAGWKGREGGYAFAQRPDATAWFREWYARWATTGRLSTLSIKIGDATIATQIYLAAGDGLFCFRTAYNEEYAKYGPGAMMLALGNEHMFVNSDAHWIDSAGDPDNAFMLEMLPERRTMSALLIGTGTRLDKGMVSVLPALLKLAAFRRRVKDHDPGS